MCSQCKFVKMSCCFTQCGGCGVFSQCKFVKMSCCFTQCGGCGVFSQCNCKNELLFHSVRRLWCVLTV